MKTASELIVIDGAHNPSGAEAMAAALDEEFQSLGSRFLLVGMMDEKDPVEMLEALGAGRADLVVCCQPDWPRALPAAALGEAAESLGCSRPPPRRDSSFPTNQPVPQTCFPCDHVSSGADTSGRRGGSAMSSAVNYAHRALLVIAGVLALAVVAGATSAAGAQEPDEWTATFSVYRVLEVDFYEYNMPLRFEYTIRSTCLAAPLDFAVWGSTNTNGSSYGTYYDRDIELRVLDDNDDPCVYTVVESATEYVGDSGPYAAVFSIDDLRFGVWRLQNRFQRTDDLTPPLELVPTVTCQAAGGRLDVNIVNDGVIDHDFTLVVGDTARQATRSPNGWWRATAGGLDDGTVRYSVIRDGVYMNRGEVSVDCDASPTVTGPDAQIFSYCSGNRGVVAAHVANATGAARTYTLQAGALTRTIQAAPTAAAVGAISGRANGELVATVRVSGTVVASETLTIDCTPVPPAPAQGVPVTVRIEGAQGWAQVIEEHVGEYGLPSDSNGHWIQTSGGDQTVTFLADVQPGERLRLGMGFERDFAVSEIYCDTVGEVNRYLRSRFTVNDLTSLDAVECTMQVRPTWEVLQGAVSAAVSCLGGNGRIDLHVKNWWNTRHDYEVTFGNLSPRTLAVAARDVGRTVVTGRQDGPITTSVREVASGRIIWQKQLFVACDTNLSTSPWEIEQFVSCRGGNGFIWWQFVNDSAERKGWVIHFEGVPNRSTSAAAYGAAVRGVSGRPDGDYRYQVLVDDVVVRDSMVTVRCD